MSRFLYIIHREGVALSKEYLLCAHKEISEVLDVLPWKSHKNYSMTEQNVNFRDLNEELIDVVKFILNLYVIWDLDENDFISMFDLKSEKVKQRLITEQQKQHE